MLAPSPGKGNLWRRDTLDQLPHKRKTKRTSRVHATRIFCRSSHMAKLACRMPRSTMTSMTSALGLARCEKVTPASINKMDRKGIWPRFWGQFEPHAETCRTGRIKYATLLNTRSGINIVPPFRRPRCPFFSDSVPSSVEIRPTISTEFRPISTTSGTSSAKSGSRGTICTPECPRAMYHNLWLQHDLKLARCARFENIARVNAQCFAYWQHCRPCPRATWVGSGEVPRIAQIVACRTPVCKSYTGRPFPKTHTPH